VKSKPRLDFINGHMTMRMRAVTVGQLPGALSKEQRRTFLREMETALHVDRPRVVLDCSEIRQLDEPIVHLLLTCLEEAMKRNGDIKLAAMPLKARESLKQMGVSHLFENFDSVVDAVTSFRKFPGIGVAPSQFPGYSGQGSESAA
jgi:anti-sigma B factor antagonist